MNYGFLTSILFCIFAVSSLIAHAEIRLFVPEFTVGPQADTQFLITNANVRDSHLELWAFTSKGELLGQVEIGLKPHTTRAITVKEAFGLQGMEVTGWLGAVSTEGDIQISYQHTGSTDNASSGSSDAVEVVSKEVTLGLPGPSREVLRVSNPNPFPAHVVLNGLDQDGVLVGNYALTIAPFAQTKMEVQPALGNAVKRVAVFSDSTVLPAVGDESQSSNAAPEYATLTVVDDMALVITSTQSVGAYQVTLRYDPKLIQFSSGDIAGGTAAGFNTRPLVVRIDNSLGSLTLASFQVGSSQTGKLDVAHIRVRRNPDTQVQFGMQIDEVTDLVGNGIRSGVDVQLSRTP